MGSLSSNKNKMQILLCMSTATVMILIRQNLHCGKEVFTDLVNVLEPLSYVDVTTMLYDVSLSRLSMVYLEPPTVSGYITLPDIVMLCDTSPHAE